MKKLFRRLFPSKEMRAYRKMYRRHRRELVKHAKKTREWDYGWLHDSIIMQIRHMHEYYTAGNNVNKESEPLSLLIESLKYVLDLNDELEHLWNYDDNNDEVVEDYNKRVKREWELREEIYSHIGEYIVIWWD